MLSSFVVSWHCPSAPSMRRRGPRPPSFFSTLRRRPRRRGKRPAMTAPAPPRLSNGPYRMIDFDAGCRIQHATAYGGMRSVSLWQNILRMDDQVRGPSRDFKIASAKAAQPVLIPIEPDLAAWFRSQGDIVREINNLCRFYMDTSISRELEFDPHAFEKTLPEQSSEPSSL
jgi:hypothetical protein